MCKTGRVVEVKDDTVIVNMVQNEDFEYCNACKKDDSFDNLLLEAYNRCNARVDDLVVIESHLKLFKRVVTIIYILPIITIFAGLGFGYFMMRTIGFEKIMNVVGLLLIMGLLGGIIIAQICWRIIQILDVKWKSRDPILIAKEISNQT